eukprot:scaffold134283_cov17-Tisochrysis_lutea.AAC.2
MVLACSHLGALVGASSASACLAIALQPQVTIEEERGYTWSPLSALYITDAGRECFISMEDCEEGGGGSLSNHKQRQPGTTRRTTSSVSPKS